MFQGITQYPERSNYGNIDREAWLAVGSPCTGIHIPFLVKMSTYLVGGGREFWVTTIGNPYLVIELDGWIYARIVLTTSENKLWVEQIRQEMHAVT